MFEALSEKLGDVFSRLRQRGALSEADVSAALREVRVALLEADVALPVAKDLIARVKERAVGQEVLRAVSPGQQVVKIVHDALVDMLGGAANEDGQPPASLTGPTLPLDGTPPQAVLMVGLQGSGKTTTTGKLGLRLSNRDRKSVLMASLDTQRPAAQEQLRVLGEQTGVATLPIVPGQSPEQIAERALKEARLQGYDVVLLDTAGRLSIDDDLMAEISRIRDRTKPAETLLVADAMTGQDAVGVAERFHQAVGVSGIVLTRTDGDARGGAALSMRGVTGCPIRLLGTGEKLDALEAFDAQRIAGRILGMGDVVGLVERAAETIDREAAEKLAAKMHGGGFDLEDFAGQLKQMRKMGGMSGLMGMLPGAMKAKAQMADANIDDGMLKRQEAIISSMTRKERSEPKLINASRRRRIAAGSGTEVSEVNRLLKQFQQMREMMRRMQGTDQKGMARKLGGMLGGLGMPGGMAGGMAGLGGMGGGMPALPGTGGADALPPDLAALAGPGGRRPTKSKPRPKRPKRHKKRR